MADPEAEAREIVERLPVLTVPCSHCPKVSQHVVPDMARAANRAIDVIATALRAAREAERADVVELVKSYKGGERECDVCGCWNLVTSILDALAHGDHVAARPAAPSEESPTKWQNGIEWVWVPKDQWDQVKARPDDAAVERVARFLDETVRDWLPSDHFHCDTSCTDGASQREMYDLLDAALAALQREA